LVKKGDFIFYAKAKEDVSTSKSLIKINKPHFESVILECFKGPEFDLLNEHQQKKIQTQLFTISKDNNRMGYKLNEILANNLPQILTSAVLPGTLQLTPSGKLIVLMRDCQVTGGYPRILQLNEASIHKLAQKTTNNRLRFELKSI
jgi:allophanate hydrolase subunit 2